VRRLIVNADDLGYDPEIDRGILEAHAGGMVRSATAMVETPFAAAALRAAPASLAIGLHAVLDPAGTEAQAEAALDRQLARFLELRGVPPTHLDSHRHAHGAPGPFAAVVRVARAHRLPVRALDDAMRTALRAEGLATADAFLGDAARRPAWTEEALLEAIRGLGPGTTELMAHPGHRPSQVRTSFGVEREVELAALTSRRVLALVRSAGLHLGSYSDLRG
jgi:chitin disaccharide deacetylase